MEEIKPRRHSFAFGNADVVIIRAPLLRTGCAAENEERGWIIMAEFKLKIPDMSCEHCEKRIREAVSKAGGRVKSLDLKNKEVVVDIEAEADKLLYVIGEAGHNAGLI